MAKRTKKDLKNVAKMPEKPAEVKQADPEEPLKATAIKTKKQQAVEFINEIRTMDSAVLNKLIVDEAGEDLAQFFLR